jgi:hypothetical protein
MAKPTHRWKMSGMDVTEQEKWGREAAYSRYGKPKYFDGAPSPPDMTRSGDKGSRPTKFGAGDVSASSWLRSDGEKNPGFVATPSGKNRSGRKRSPGF